MVLKIVKKENLKYLISSGDRFVAEIEPEESVEVECEINCNGGVITGPASRLTRDNVNFPFLNPATGPIRVVGAGPGQALSVHIEKVDLDPLGYTGMFPHCGLFPDWIWNREERFFDTRPKRVSDGVIHWNDRLKIPVRPMVGVIGVAPKFGGVLALDNGEHGGNLDVQELGPGARLILPVEHDGAHLFLGDCHARQGDGEVAGMGATEISARVTFRVSLAPRPKRMSWPRFETPTHIGTIGCARPLEDAMRIAFAEMIYWMADEYGIPEPDAYMLLGTIAEARGTQAVNPKFTYICKVAKEFLV
jgi:acetamidase/formamidase